MKLRDLGMKTHKKTRIILIIIVALVAIFSSIAIITTTANKNNANAWVAGTGGVYGSADGATSALAAGDMWWFGFENADESSAYAAMSNVYGQGFPWNSSSKFRSDHMAGRAVSQAIIDCENRHSNKKCDDAKLVALGWVQYVAGSDGKAKWCNKDACPSYSGDLIMTPTPCWDKTVNNINLKDTAVCSSLRDKVNGKDLYTVLAAVLAKDEYQHSGWKPVFTKVTSDAYTNKVQTTSTQLAPCVYAYSMQTIGVDGYVRNYATTLHTYKTAYGKFLDDVANHKYDGSYYYVGNGSNQITANANLQKTMNDKLISDYKIACDAANKEVDNYNIESEEKPDKTGSNVISGKEFLQRYAKGGVYKVKRSKLNGVLNYKTTNVKYYKSTASYYKLTGWTPCTNENDGTWIPGTNTFVSCGYWGWTNAPSNDTYPDKYGITHTGWSEISINDNVINNIDKNKSILYYIGYIDENGTSHGDEKIKAKNATEWSTHLNAFKYGFTPNDDPASFSNKLHPVKQEYTSWIHVWHQDFMNILCNKNDFDNYKTALKTMYGDDIYTDISKVSDGSKYQGQLKSPVIDSEFISKHNVSDTWEPFDRVLYTVSTDLTTDNKLDMANAFTNIKSVVGDTSAATLLTKAKSVNSAYNTDNFISWYNSAAYDASLDPVYTKECPYDCTSNSKGYAGGAQYNIVDGSTSDGASDNAYLLKRNVGEGSTSDYGVRVRTTDSKGNLKPSTEDVNTANMTFFRNNAWSRFRVDLWYPVLDNGLTEAKPTDSIAGISETKGSQTAKSTTIIRNNGTPWYVKGTDSSSGFATEMKAIKSIDDGDSIDGSNARLFNETTDIIPGNQISLGSVTAHGAHVVELPYEATAFAIRSMWATDPNIGKLEFNIKWEFDTKNNLDVPTKFTVGNTADSVSSTSTPQYAISDGKCYARNSYNERIDEKNLINLFHDNTGAGTIDNLDKEFSDNFGKFTIQFVRATAE